MGGPTVVVTALSSVKPTTASSSTKGASSTLLVRGGFVGSWRFLLCMVGAVVGVVLVRV